jgi:hypothetical protein
MYSDVWSSVEVEHHGTTELRQWIAYQKHSVTATQRGFFLAVSKT